MEQPFQALISITYKSYQPADFQQLHIISKN